MTDETTQMLEDYEPLRDIGLLLVCDAVSALPNNEEPAVQSAIELAREANVHHVFPDHGCPYCYETRNSHIGRDPSSPVGAIASKLCASCGRKFAPGKLRPRVNVQHDVTEMELLQCCVRKARDTGWTDNAIRRFVEAYASADPPIECAKLWFKLDFFEPEPEDEEG